MIARMNREQDIDQPDNHPKRERVNYYTAREEEDPFPDPSLIDPLDSDQAEDITKGIEEAIKKAVENGLPAEHHDAMKKVVYDHVDIFRTTFSSGPPAKFPPLKIELTADAKPVKVRLRKYSQPQRAFMQKLVKKLISCGMAYYNPTSPWACAPLIVPKPGSVEFRFTVDLRPLNKYIVKHQFPMPNLEVSLTIVSRSKFFAKVDFVHSYWQMLLEKLSQESQSFLSEDGIVTPTRVPHGTTNAVTHLQSSITTTLPEELKSSILVWLDDILVHAPTIPELIEKLNALFDYCASYNLKLHPLKCILFATVVRWCGRLISAEGVRFDPRRLDGIQKMQPPTLGSHLQQFVCAMQWMRSGIPDFSNIVRPLMEFLERVYTRAGKRTRTAAARIQLSDLGWSQTELEAFNNCKNAVAHQVTLSHPDPKKRLCVYTDASDYVWSGIVTQTPREDIHLDHVDQRHQPLSFLSGHFTGSELGWSILEKEAYAIMATVERMHWLLSTPSGFDLFTDHHNLIFIFDPLAVMPDLSQSSVRKVFRWAVKLSD